MRNVAAQRLDDNFISLSKRQEDPTGDLRVCVVCACVCVSTGLSVLVFMSTFVLVSTRVYVCVCVCACVLTGEAMEH